jgi:hypothetical protein
MFRSLTLLAILIIVIIATSTSTSIALAIGTSPPQTLFANNNTVSKLLTTPAPRNALLSEANTTNNATLTNNTSSTTSTAQPSSLASPAVIRAAISFGGIKNLSNNAGDSREPLVDVSGNIVYVVWVDLTTPTGSGDILFKRSTDGGNTFGNTVNLSNDVGDSGLPIIAKSGSNLYILWTDFSNQDILFKRSADNGATFASTVNLSMDTNRSSAPHITASGNNVYIVWEDLISNIEEARLLFRASNNNGASFGTAKVISPVVVESIAAQVAASGNNVYIAGHDGSEDNTEIFFMRSTNNGGSFSNPISINNNHEASIFNKIIADANNVYLVYMDNSRNNFDVFFRRSTDNGASFKDIINLSNNAEHSGSPAMGVIGGNVYVAWVDSTTNQPGTDILFKTSTNSGASFSSTKNISNNPGESGFPQISRSGTAVRIVWQDWLFGGQTDVLFRASGDNGFTFGNIRNLSGNNAGMSENPMIISSGDNMYVVWQDNTSGNSEILFVKGTA